MKKDQVINKLEAAWQEFKNSFDGLNQEQMTNPGVVGEWSIKDIIAHIATWEEEALKNLPMIERNKTVPRYKDLYGGLDAFNAQMSEKKKSLSLPETFHQMDATHQQLLGYINTIPDEFFIKETRFRRRLRLDTYSHYRVHTDAIKEWRRQNNF